MFYLRKIPDLTEWSKLQEASEPDLSVKLLADFADMRLSVYKIDKEEEARRIGAALCFANSNGASKCFFATAICKDIEALVKVSKTEGDTGHKDTDNAHFELQLRTSKMVDTIVRQFLLQEPIAFQAVEIATEIKRMFDAAEYDLKKISKPRENRPGPTYGILRSLTAELLTLTSKTLIVP